MKACLLMSLINHKNSAQLRSTKLEKYYRQPELWEMSRYEGNIAQRQRATLIAGMIDPDTESVLDVGCGNGFVTRKIKANRVIGLDPSSEALSLFEGYKLIGVADALPFSDSSFETVVCCEVIEHLPGQVFNKAIMELARVANRQIIIGVPYRQDLRLGMIKCKDCGCRYHVDLHCRSFYNAETIARLFPTWDLEMTVLIGRRLEIRSKIFRWLRYHLAGSEPYSDLVCCPDCGSILINKGNKHERKLINWLFKNLAWRMSKQQLAVWMIVSLRCKNE